MNDNLNEIVLRPRFKMEISLDNEVLLQAFEASKTEQNDFIVNRIDEHVFIKIPNTRHHFWSPQLHLEINKIEPNKCVLHGLFGPSPTVWTLFMFLHFIVIGLFFGFGIWAYTNWSLKINYSVQLFLVLLMVVVWFGLYFGGRIGKSTGAKQMHELNNFMILTLKKLGITNL